MYFGVIRPDWDVERGDGAEEEADAFDEDGHCFYSTNEGFRGNKWSPGNHDWEGMQTANEPGDRIGMLLDLDQGSMTVWKNDVRLGVMVAEGLVGPYCWAAEVLTEGVSVRVSSAPATASPLEEDLAAAEVWQHRNGLRLPHTATDAECEEAAEVA